MPTAAGRAGALAADPPDETLVVVRVDRLARSVGHLLAVIEQLEANGAHFRSLRDPIDTTTPQGMFSLQVLGAVAQAPTGGAARAAELDELSRRAAVYATPARGDGTRRAYRSAWRQHDPGAVRSAARCSPAMATPVPICWTALSVDLRHPWRSRASLGPPASQAAPAVPQARQTRRKTPPAPGHDPIHLPCVGVELESTRGPSLRVDPPVPADGISPHRAGFSPLPQLAAPNS